MNRSKYPKVNKKNILKVTILLVTTFMVFLPQTKAQVFFSQIMTKSFVGPENVTDHNGDLSKYYINEVRTAIYTLEELLDGQSTFLLRRIVKTSDSLFDIENETCSKSQIRIERKRLGTLLKTWSRHARLVQQSDLTPPSAYNEHLSWKEVYPIKNDSIQFKRTFVNRKPTCLSANPNDCLVWNLIETNNLIIIDDYGTPFNPKWHYLSEVHLDEALSALVSQRSMKHASLNK